MQRKSQCLEREPDYVVDMLRQQLAWTYELYPPLRKRQEIHLSLFRVPAGEKYEPIKEIVVKLQAVREELAAAIIFSSVATGDIVEYWSDVDVMVIVKQEVLRNSERFMALRSKLLELEGLLYKFDPWQHHGIQFIAEADLMFYPESFLPISAIKEGASLLERVKFKIATRDSTAEQEEYFFGLEKLMSEAAETGELRHHCQDGVCLQEDFANVADNFYQLKYFVSVILLTPSLYIGLVDKPIYKRKSFAKIREYFSEEELELVTACERVRGLFATIKPKGNAIPDEVIPVLGENYFRRAKRLLDIMISKYEIHKSSPAA